MVVGRLGWMINIFNQKCGDWGARTPFPAAFTSDCSSFQDRALRTAALQSPNSRIPRICSDSRTSVRRQNTCSTFSNSWSWNTCMKSKWFSVIRILVLWPLAPSAGIWLRCTWDSRNKGCSLRSGIINRGIARLRSYLCRGKHALSFPSLPPWRSTWTHRFSPLVSSDNPFVYYGWDPASDSSVHLNVQTTNSSLYITKTVLNETGTWVGWSFWDYVHEGADALGFGGIRLYGNGAAAFGRLFIHQSR